MTTSLTVLSDWLIALLVDVSLKAILLAALAGGGMWLLRMRATSVQHRMWTAVLVGMLVMPLLVTWTPAVPLPSWAYPDLRSDNGQEVAVDDNISTPIAPTIVAEESPMREPAAAPPSVATSPTATAIEQTSVPPTFVPSAANWTDRVSTLIVVSYTLGVALFGGRLLIGLLAARRLVRTAKPIDLSPHQAAEIGTTRVVESPQVRVPLTVGWLRPKIVLPSDWPSWSEEMLTAVLAHEQAHVRRRDPWVAFLAQVNLAIYWFHPVAWFLARRLTTLAESVCDDAVIESLGDRTTYAHHLLAVAGRLTGQPRRLQPLGVAMAARPAVEQRIEAILDDRRPLARRVGWLGTLLLLVAITPVVLLAAGITADKGNPEVDTAPPFALASDTGSLLLTVLDDNDAPVPGANAAVRIRQVFMGPDTYTHHQTDDAGRLKFDVPTPTPYYLSASVNLPGYAPFLAEWENHDTPDPIPAEYTAHLDPGRTIGGIVHDEKGQPIEGVSVCPQFNLKQREERTSQMGAGVGVKTDANGAWIYESLPAEVQDLPITFEQPEYTLLRLSEPAPKFAVPAGGHPSVVTVMKRGIKIGGTVRDAGGKPIDGAIVTYYEARNPRSNSPTTKTNHVGEYQFRNGQVGDALLTVSAARFAPAMQNMLIASNMKPVDFQLTAGSPLGVRVVGPDRRPLPDTYVSFWNWDEHGVYGNLPESHGNTDADGVWQWSHAPAGVLKFHVSRNGYRYISGQQLTPGSDNVVVMTPEKAADTRVIKVAGRVVDSATKTPIARFQTTPGIQWKNDGKTNWLHESQSSGRDGQYRREFTRHDLGKDSYALALRVEADGYTPKVSQVVLGDEEDFTIDFALDKAADEGFRVLTPSGAAAAGAAVAVCKHGVYTAIEDGMISSSSSCERATADETGHFSIAPQEGRFDLMVLHDSGAAHVTQFELQKSHAISLEPWANVEGTLRIHDRPAANETITLDDVGAPIANAPSIYYQYQTKTDENGKFGFERVVPGDVRVSRVILSDQGNGMTRSAPTHSMEAKLVPGSTTDLNLGRIGRQIVGKLVIPPDAKPGNDWRLAMVTLQWSSADTPKPPKVPFPLRIDPQKDQDAAKIWWEQWRFTDEGKQYQQDFKRFVEASRKFKPAHYMAPVEPDGTFTFDDMPSGDYRLTIRASAATATVLGGPNEEIATLDHTFSIPDAGSDTGDASKPVDLGELTLRAIEQPKPSP